MAADVFGMLAAFGLTAYFVGGHVIGGVGGKDSLAFAAAIPGWILVAKLYGLYDHDEERTGHSSADEFVDIFHLVTVGVWLYFAGIWVFGLGNPSERKLTVFWLLAIATVAGARGVARAAARRQPLYQQNAIIVGAGDVGQLIARKLRQHPEYGINLRGFVDTNPKERREDLDDLTLLGGPQELHDIVCKHNVDRVIIAFSSDRHPDLLLALHSLRKDGVHIDVVPRLFEAINPRVGIHSVEGLPLLGLPPARIPRSSRFLKRSFDIAVSGTLVILSAPLMAIIALLIRRDSPGPVFFRQTRLGMDMREFKLLKFRTMRQDTDDQQHREYIAKIMDASAAPTDNALYKLDRSDAITRVGRWLRGTSLDELPQLFNILRGDMSLVGPRPCIPYETEFFAPHHFDRFLVPAGLTGLWQVEARAHSTFGEALDLDVLYVRGWSLGLDLRLFVRTPFLILRPGHTG